MPHIEYHTGKLKRVDLSDYDNNVDKFFEQKCRDRWGDSQTEEDWEADIDFYRAQGSDNPWVTAWFDETSDWDKYIIHKGELWEIQDLEIESSNQATKINDDEYQYDVSFSNMASSLHEEIEILLNSRI
jgi:hypothetical protein